MPKAEPYAFRPLAAVDLPLLAKWLESRHVRRWWSDPAEALASMEEHIDAASVSSFMVTMNGKDFAFIQSADLSVEDDEALAGQPQGTYGIDQFIGIEELAGKGHGPAFMIRFCDMLFAKGARRILVDPHPDNTFAIRAYTKAGFQGLGETTTNYGRALLMALDRQESDTQ